MNFSDKSLEFLSKYTDFTLRTNAQKVLFGKVMRSDKLAALITLCSPKTNKRDRMKGIVILKYLTEDPYYRSRLVDYGAIRVLIQATDMKESDEMKCYALSAILDLITPYEDRSYHNFKEIAAKKGLLEYLQLIIATPDCPTSLLNIAIIVSQQYSLEGKYHKSMIDLGYMPAILRATIDHMPNVSMVRYSMETLVRLCTHFSNAYSDRPIKELIELYEIGVINLMQACIRSDDPGVASWGIGLLHEFVSRDIGRKELRESPNFTKWMCRNLVTSKYAYTNQLIIRSFWHLTLGAPEFFDTIFKNSSHLRRILATFAIEDTETNYWATALVSEIASKSYMHMWMLKSPLIEHIYKYVSGPASSQATSMIQCMSSILFCLCESNTVAPVLHNYSLVQKSIKLMLMLDVDEAHFRIAAALNSVCSYSSLFLEKLATPDLIKRLCWLVLNSENERVQQHSLKALLCIMSSGIIEPGELLSCSALPFLQRIHDNLSDMADVVLGSPDFIGNPRLRLALNTFIVMTSSIQLSVVREYARLSRNVASDKKVDDNNSSSSGSTPEGDELFKKASETLENLLSLLTDICFSILPTVLDKSDDFYTRISKVQAQMSGKSSIRGSHAPLYFSNIVISVLSEFAESEKEPDGGDLSESPPGSPKTLYSSLRKSISGGSKRRGSSVPEKSDILMFSLSVITSNYVQVICNIIYPTDLGLHLWRAGDFNQTSALRLFSCLDPHSLPERQAVKIVNICAKYLRDYEEFPNVLSESNANSDFKNSKPDEKNKNQVSRTIDYTVDTSLPSDVLILSESFHAIYKQNEDGLKYFFARLVMDRFSTDVIDTGALPGPVSEKGPISSPARDGVILGSKESSDPKWRFKRGCLRGSEFYTDVLISATSDKARKRYYSITRNIPSSFSMLGDSMTVFNSSWKFESIRTTMAIDGKLGGRHIFTVQLLTHGLMQIGWSTERCWFEPESGQGVGDDFESVAYDGCRQRKWFGTADESSYGEKWEVYDTIQAVLDFNQESVEFFKNGKSMGVAFGKDSGGIIHGSECGFTKLSRDRLWFPTVSLSNGQGLRIIDHGISPSTASAVDKTSRPLLSTEFISRVDKMVACFAVKFWFIEKIDSPYIAYLDLPGHNGRVIVAKSTKSNSLEDGNGSAEAEDEWWLFRAIEESEAMAETHKEFSLDLEKYTNETEPSEEPRAVRLKSPIVEEEWFILNVNKDGVIEFMDSKENVLAKLCVDCEYLDTKDHLWSLQIPSACPFQTSQICP
ncbi:hypothetical protein H4219_001511 [Mycoemilia scoparia]|uniref:B30.2/SPRY domain-containing protein n=1 Tax=Mycoemilia scoparia TaxID=417184 RepID=A0A9W8A3A8_9FUNG|nr:hypothetical protein H4219_001511 [Mycoemilia scoparia]